MAEENAAAEAPANAAPAKGGGGGMMPALLIIVLMPLISFAMFKFLFIPMIKAELPQNDEPQEIDPATVEHLHLESGELSEYSFENEIVVNLKGVAMTRFLQVSITFTSFNTDIANLAGKNKNRLRSSSMQILGNLTLAELEKPEIRNLTASQLKQQYEQILGGHVEEVLFTNWVVQ
ncbi:MAG: flagellar basal body-associated FliL family protein [Verrucomicrobiota bacterium]